MLVRNGAMAPTKCPTGYENENPCSELVRLSTYWSARTPASARLEPFELLELLNPLELLEPAL